jgi:hypothetical protein
MPSKPQFQVVVHYPISAAAAAKLEPHEYPSECHVVGDYVRFAAAKSACRRKNDKLGGNAYAAIVDLRIGSQITPNSYGRYEGYE